MPMVYQRPIDDCTWMLRLDYGQHELEPGYQSSIIEFQEKFPFN